MGNYSDEQHMTTGELRASTWVGWVGMSLFGVGMIVAGFLPPLSPSLSVAEIQHLYQSNSLSIRLGSILMLISGCSLIPFIGAVSGLIRQIESESGSVRYMQAIAGVPGLVMPIVIAPLFFGAAAYRAERAADLIYLLNDLGWIILVMLAPTAFVQWACTGIAILADRSPQPVLRRWVGYVNLWAALAALPEGVVLLFYRGPFAWNGLLTFWIGAVGTVAWLGAMGWEMLRLAGEKSVPVASASRVHAADL